MQLALSKELAGCVLNMHTPVGAYQQMVWVAALTSGLDTQAYFKDSMGRMHDALVMGVLVTVWADARQRAAGLQSVLRWLPAHPLQCKRDNTQQAREFSLRERKAGRGLECRCVAARKRGRLSLGREPKSHQPRCACLPCG